MRILIVEDDPVRYNLLASWLPADAHLVQASSAGRALGIINLDRGRVYDGIMLDHDLEKQPLNADDLRLSGTHVAQRIVQVISNDVPVLVHSTNPGGGARMVQILEGAEFGVTWKPFQHMKRRHLEEWVEEEVRGMMEDE